MIHNIICVFITFFNFYVYISDYYYHHEDLRTTGMNQVQSRARSSSPSSRKLKEATIDFLKCLALSLSTGTCPASRGKSRPARGSWRGHATPRA